MESVNNKEQELNQAKDLVFTILDEYKKETIAKIQANQAVAKVLKSRQQTAFDGLQLFGNQSEWMRGMVSNVSSNRLESINKDTLLLITLLKSMEEARESVSNRTVEDLEDFKLLVYKLLLMFLTQRI